MTAPAAPVEPPREKLEPRHVVVQAEGVKKIYKMGDQTTYALRGVDLDIYSGEYLSIMGPSGSGKSTFFNMVGGLDKPSEGRVKINGNDVSKLNGRQLAWLRCHEIGYIFQTYNILPSMSALENVILPMIFSGKSESDAKKRGMELLAMVGLDQRPHHRPDELSGGQQQRVAIARALANDPAIILADEPTANLDSKTGEEIINLMCKLKAESGVTIISATHDHKMLEVSDRVVWIRDGQIARVARRDELKIEHGSIGAGH